MRITSAGNVGIGTSSPSATYGRLTVAGTGITIADDGSAKLQIGRYSAGLPISYIKMGANSTGLRFTNPTDSADLMAITSAGNVGIGTISPATLLEISANNGGTLGGAPNNTLRFNDTDTTQIANQPLGRVEFYVNDGSAGGTGIGAYMEGLAAGTSGGGYLTFATSPNTATGAAERLRIDSAGNVGIGTSAPLLKLDVSGKVKFTGVEIGVGEEYTSNIYFEGGFKYRATGFGTVIGASSGAITFSNTASSGSAGASATVTERARITSGGYFKASFDGSYLSSTGTYHEFTGTTANGYTLRARCTNATPANHYITDFLFTAASPNNTGALFIECRDSTAARIELRSNGGIANYSANDVNLSDRREKTNFAPAKSYLETICAIPVQTFNYIDQNQEEDPGLTLGVVAQDVQAVAPELVMESNWGSKDDPKMRLSIYQTDLQYALMKCIQEQQAIITALTTRVEALEGAQA
jgi:hypothetical protein